MLIAVLRERTKYAAVCPTMPQWRRDPDSVGECSACMKDRLEKRIWCNITVERVL
jgi:hypothetical protein